MSFLENMKEVADNEFNVSVTENGALGYKTSGKQLLNISYSVSTLRNMSEKDIVKRFLAAFYEDKLLALKWLFFAADVREGQGERRTFRAITQYLAESEPAIMRALLPLIPEYTRWDNLVELTDTKVGNAALDIISEQLRTDIADCEAGKSISLLAKWLPSNNASSKATCERAHLISRHLGMTNAEYRRTLSKLRAYLDLVEVKMSARRFGEINYEHVPSRANVIYRGAFLRDDEERRREYLGALRRGEVKINASVLYPHDIVHRYFSSGDWYGIGELDETLEALWRSLPDYVEGDAKTLCVADGSGSMFGRIDNTEIKAISVANALAIYFSERSSGEFKNKYISFSDDPQLVDLSGAKSLHDKLGIALANNEVATTNIEAVFDLILLTAIKSGMKQEDMPKTVLILSDMEFNNAISLNGVRKGAVLMLPRIFEVIKERFKSAGYLLPRLVFWNILSRTGTIPLRENENGVALVGGFSPTTVKMVLSEELDPYKCLVEQLNTERYLAVEKALSGIEL